MLLNVVRGAQSSTDLKMVNKINYATFKAACFVYGLLNDDKEWTDAIEEVSIWAMAQQLRDLFVTILLFCDVSRPLKLWEENWVRLSEDILDKKRKHYRYPDLNLSNEQVRNYSLLEIQDLSNTHGGTGKTFLYKTIIARLRSEQMIVLAVATSETHLDFTLRQGDDEYLTERAILTPRNDDADAINENMFKKLGGPSVTYNSVDEICKASTDTADQYDLYPVEFLNSLSFQGMPPMPSA
nr:ATP-dependent DNA helicase PIF1-like [Tanacetum cinerariifolium]